MMENHLDHPEEWPESERNKALEEMAIILYEDSYTYSDVASYAITHDCSVTEAVEMLYAVRIQRIGGMQ